CRAGAAASGSRASRRPSARKRRDGRAEADARRQALASESGGSWVLRSPGHDGAAEGEAAAADARKAGLPPGGEEAWLRPALIEVANVRAEEAADVQPIS